MQLQTDLGWFLSQKSHDVSSHPTSPQLLSVWGTSAPRHHGDRVAVPHGVCVCVCVCACACVHVRERSPSPRQDTGSDWYGPCQKGQHISNLEYLLLVISQTVSLSSKSITHDSVHVHLNQAKRYSNNINKQDGNVMFFSLNFFRRFRCQLKNVLLISL